MTEGAPTEPADLVDVSYAPFVRPLGNLVVLFAQAETAWLKLVAILTGCNLRNHLAQEFEPLAPKLCGQKGQSCNVAPWPVEACHEAELNRIGAAR